MGLKVGTLYMGCGIWELVNGMVDAWRIRLAGCMLNAENVVRGLCCGSWKIKHDHSLIFAAC